MNKPENKHVMAIPNSLLLTVLTAVSAQAQTTAAAYDSRSNATRALGFAPRLRLSLAPAGFALMPSASGSANLAHAPAR